MSVRYLHIVPLPRQVLALLAELMPLAGSSPFLFHATTNINRPMSENTLSYATGRMGYSGTATPHGFRALASTVLNEEGFYPDIIERQLTHAERNKIRAAYRRAEYLEDRRKMMQWWADCLDKHQILMMDDVIKVPSVEPKQGLSDLLVKDFAATSVLRRLQSHIRPAVTAGFSGID